MRLVEGDLMRHVLRPQNRHTQFRFDYGLVCALLDRWHPETHTFHFPWGEMMLTLQDVALLLGLPCAGRAMGRLTSPDVTSGHPSEVRASGPQRPRPRASAGLRQRPRTYLYLVAAVQNSISISLFIMFS